MSTEVIIPDYCRDTSPFAWTPIKLGESNSCFFCTGARSSQPGISITSAFCEFHQMIETDLLIYSAGGGDDIF